MPGAPTSRAEVTNIGAQGLWMLVDGAEHFLDYERYPWFRQGTVAEVLNVQRPSTEHLWWPDLDVDLSVDHLLHPERFPLMSRVTPRVRDVA